MINQTSCTKFNASISISRTSGGEESHPITIRVDDRTSRCLVLEVRLSLEAFAEALTGLGYRDCFGTWFNAPIGKKREIKTERIKWNRLDRNEEAAKAAVSLFEVDGWNAHLSDLFNHHNRCGDGTQRVSFYRFVEADGDDPKGCETPQDGGERAE